MTVLRARDVVAPTPEARSRAIVNGRSGGRCEIGIPGLCTGRREHFSHRQAKGQGGLWAVPNGVAACARCHLDWVEHEPDLARSAGLRVPSWGDPERTPVFLRVPYGIESWWFLLPDGTYDCWHALDAALALGFPEVPEWRRTA